MAIEDLDALIKEFPTSTEIDMVKERIIHEATNWILNSTPADSRKHFTGLRQWATAGAEDSGLPKVVQEITSFLQEQVSVSSFASLTIVSSLTLYRTATWKATKWKTTRRKIA